MLTIEAAVNNFVDYIDRCYQGTLFYDAAHNFHSFCSAFRKPDIESKTVSVSITISERYDGVAAYNGSWVPYIFDIVVIFENGQSSTEVKFSINGSDRLTEFLSVFACFICLNDEHYLADDKLFALLPDKVDLSHIIRAIEIDHNIELLSRMIEDIYHYCKDGSYEKHIRAMLDHFASAEHNDPELTAVILNKMHELGIVNEDVSKLKL